MAVAVWVVAAVSVTMLTFAGSHAAHAQAAQTTGSRATHAQAAQTSAATPRGVLRRPGHGDRPHIRRCEAVPDRHSALGLRVVPGPTVAVALARLRGLAFDIVFAQAVEIALALAFAVAFALAFASVVISVAVALRRSPRRRRLEADGPDAMPRSPGTDRHQLAN